MADRKYTLGKENVLDSWSALVENGGGKAQWTLDAVEQAIQNSNMEGIICYQADVGSGMFGKRRTFLLVGLNSQKDYHLFVSARDFGVHLDVAWYLTLAPSFFKRALARLATRNPQALLGKIELFDQQDLAASYIQKLWMRAKAAYPG